MKKIEGRVVVQETGAGIANLVVVVAHVQKAPDAKLLGAATERVNAEEVWASTGARRLGSVLTDQNGEFRFARDSTSSVAGGAEAINLALFLFAPEQPSDHGCLRLLHASCAIRWGAGSEESFSIMLPVSLLREAGVPVPAEIADAAEPAETVVGRIQVASERIVRVARGLRELAEQRVSTERALMDSVIEPDIEELLQSLSTARPGDARHVAPGQSIEEATRRAIMDGISHIHGSVRAGYLAISDEQLRQLREIDPNLRELPATAVEGAIFGQTSPLEQIDNLVRSNPLAAACRDQTLPRGNCGALDSDGRATGTDTEDGNVDASSIPVPSLAGAAGDALPEHIRARVADLIAPITPPEGILGPLSGSRPDVGDVQGKVDALSLRSGPADGPAYFDFHALHIAFEHVWEEAFDDKVRTHARDLYRSIVELGGTPVRIRGHGIKGLYREASAIVRTHQEEPPASVIQVFELAPAEWRVLRADHRAKITQIAERILDRPTSISDALQAPARNASLFGQGQRILAYARAKLEEREILGVDHVNGYLRELDARLREPYVFKIFAARPHERSINFGLLVSYRQKWEPIAYQVGELVKTIPLAPREVRKYTKKQTLKTSRTRKVVERATESRQTEAVNTTRDITDIIRQAQQRTAFEMTTQGSFNFLLKDATLSGSLTKEASESSSETKQRFREAVRKAAEEYRHERTIEVSSEVSETFESEESGEIANPNDEITVTYLFYELQRRFRVSETIHRLTPVVFVAQEVPRPDEIDEDWLLTHAWILRRALLDGSFREALELLPRLAGMELALLEQRKHLSQQRKLVEELKHELLDLRGQLGARYAALERAIATRSAVVARDDAEGFLEKTADYLFGEYSTSEDAARLREEAAKDAYERAMRAAADAEARLEREVSALTRATEAHTAALTEHKDRQTLIAQLRVHVKQNILYYMHAIWDHEPPDQRFFRLYRVPAPTFAGTRRYKLRADPDAAPQPPLWIPPMRFELSTTLEPALAYGTLAEVADLDNLLGYKGNYMIFPLRQANALTAHMMAPYVDAAAGLKDPDWLGNVTPEELGQYVCCLERQLSAEEFEQIVPQIRELYRRMLTHPRPINEEIIVPTGNLYIEALPGAHPVVEEYKLTQRAIDVRKVMAEARAKELENARYALRLATGDLADPSIDKTITIVGSSQPVIAVGAGTEGARGEGNGATDR